MNALENLVMAVVMFFAGLFGMGDATVDELQEVEEQPAYEEATVVSVVDGDTIVVDINGVQEFVRLIGIDAPEHSSIEGGIEVEHECYAREATQKATELMLTKHVHLVRDVENRDKYNRLLRHVYVDETLVGEELVRDGYARTLTIPPNTRHKDLLHEAQGSAQASDRGLWGACEMLVE